MHSLEDWGPKLTIIKGTKIQLNQNRNYEQILTNNTTQQSKEKH